MANIPSDNELKEIGLAVCDAAYTIFSDCGEPEDFCVQYISQSIVFGGHNRLIYTPGKGFRLDHSYCRPEFLLWFKLHPRMDMAVTYADMVDLQWEKKYLGDGITQFVCPTNKTYSVVFWHSGNVYLGIPNDPKPIQNPTFRDIRKVLK